MYLLLCQPRVLPSGVIIPKTKTCQIVVQKCTLDGCGVVPMQAPSVKVNQNNKRPV